MDIIQIWETGRLANQSIDQMAIHCCIHLKDESGKKHMKTNEATAALLLVSAQTVQGIVKVKDVKAIPYDDLLSI